MKNWKISLLLSYYGGMLTEKQREAIELYYDADLSLAEIAEIVKITRQGVRDAIKRGEEQLLELEKRLGLAQKLERIADMMDLMGQLAFNINKESTDYQYPVSIQRDSKKIMDTVGEYGQMMAPDDDDNNNN